MGLNLKAFDWRGTLATVAPVLATALGGPLAGVAVKVAADALGIAPDEDAVAAAVSSGDPGVLVKLKEADLQFQAHLATLEVDLERIAGQDRDSARQREMVTQDLTPRLLAAVILTGFFATLYMIAFEPLPPAAEEPVLILLGALTAMVTQVGNYYFGSTAGSARKTELLGKK